MSDDRGLRGAYDRLREQGLGRVRAALHTPLFYLVAYRHAERIARRGVEGDRHD